MARLIAQIVLICALLAAGYWVIPQILDRSKELTTETQHQVALQEIIQMGQLNLVKYQFKDIVEHTIVRDFLPDPKALLIIEGEATGCIDLTKIKSSDFTFQGDSLFLQLPEPEICQYKIDHQKSRIYQTEYAFMNEKLLMDGAYKQAEKKIYESALASGILEDTKKSAEQILKPFLEQSTRQKVFFSYPKSAPIDRLK